MKHSDAIKRFGYEASAASDNLRYIARRLFIVSGHRSVILRLLRKIDRIYKIYRIDLLHPNPVNLVNPVYFHCFWTSQCDLLNYCRLAISAARTDKRLTN